MMHVHLQTFYRAISICLSVLVAISIPARAQTDESLNKLLHEEYGPEDTVIGRISGSADQKHSSLSKQKVLLG